MAAIPVKIPFVDLAPQHEPIQAHLEEAIKAVLQRGDFVLGQGVANFEAAFSKASGAEYGVGVACGTDGIALGLEACGIGAGDEVILPANTFVATLIGIVQTGATPVMVDCDRDTALIDLTAAAEAVTPKTKAIVPVHLYGQMVSPQQLLNFAQTHNLIIFEDAAQAHLAKKEGYKAGSIGKGAAFSFYPSKNLGAFGDAGMLLTSDATVAAKARALRNYGACRKYFHTEPGRNSRLDTLQANILNLKLPFLQQWNQARSKAGKLYDTYIKELQLPGIVPIQNQSDTGHIYHLYVVKVTESCPSSRQQIQESLTSQGIQTGIHYPTPCHLQPAYEYLGYKEGDFPHAEILATEILSLPMYPGIKDLQVQEVVETLQTILIGKPGLVTGER
ncbi:MAG: DegT/DnrJ/EryC1/StrS family aminotransferase [Spirulinaceae cyanobacterium]